ncbi:FtsW/RodA/SpoVE family cell cycle protein [Sulfuricurvum sp.]|uniref:FtsW/RodA/SpoVE family cell cycle protein n=1 Tax=Sulfuricurvum sp. TaxID=2025608 RepID=UPI00261F8478|nr:FtsW/RodA/SpoVE family cell cycle protein [Sulfuricurvum sp.]MDD2265909.1 FtsW/RodA/SpoVE family cell cycle protein [Sulfuricurvum sp.]MDD2782935.1 FtsW/RodA/SpoVE family cell cycle protein [Sulfuricurvum sp.]HZF70614.1 FtsW/RodA/SpoVE family cell cycle protein [Sulfuricurvum sp.]
MPDKKLFLLTTALITIGIICSYTLSAYTVILFEYDDFHFVIRELIVGIISILLMWSLAQLDPDVWLHRLGLGLFFGGIVLMLIMPFLPASLVSEVGGAKRWIKLFGFSLAPVEYFKIGFVYFLAWSFSRKLGHHGNMGVVEEFKRFFPYAAIFILVMFLIAFLQNDLGQVIVLALTLAFMLFFAGSSFRFFMTLIGGSVSFFLFFILTSEHRINRILSWWATAQSTVLAFFPESIAKHLRIENGEEAYQIGHSLNAIHNGGIFGTGLGGGTFKLGFLSEVHTDFVLAGIAEEFGFIGVFGVVLLFIMLLHRLFKIANRSYNDTAYLFSLGVGLLITFAFMVNAYGISGLTPIKGISVPFLSYGGSTMMASAIGIGMVLMLSKKITYKSGDKK